MKLIPKTRKHRVLAGLSVTAVAVTVVTACIVGVNRRNG